MTCYIDLLYDLLYTCYIIVIYCYIHAHTPEAISILRWPPPPWRHLPYPVGFVSLRPVGTWLVCLLRRPSGWVPPRFALTSCWARWVRAPFCHRPGVWSFARFALTCAGLVGFCLRPGWVPGRFGLASCWACWVLAPLWPGAPHLHFCWAYWILRPFWLLVLPVPLNHKVPMRPATTATKLHTHVERDFCAGPLCVH